jgi:hypothetical protein
MSMRTAAHSIDETTHKKFVNSKKLDPRVAFLIASDNDYDYDTIRYDTIRRKARKTKRDKQA